MNACFRVCNDGHGLDIRGGDKRKGERYIPRCLIRAAPNSQKSMILLALIKHKSPPVISQSEMQKNKIVMTLSNSVILLCR